MCEGNFASPWLRSGGKGERGKEPIWCIFRKINEQRKEEFSDGR
jgi:hypothetical protein